tara:strand:- start:1824 stop:2594 length:771 start_codon:yes stop_codon:yes gene_type:complete
MKIKIIKANANGNSFIIINNIKNNMLIDDSFIKLLCNKHNADGFIILDSNDINAISMEYYNNDGSWETLCINGLICSAKLLHMDYQKNNLKVKCGDGLHEIKKNGDLFQVTMPKPKYKSKKIKLAGVEGYYIDSGAKHFVVHQKHPWPNDNLLIKTAQEIRYNKKIFPDGINVNFYKITTENTLDIKTYEKGIEKLMDSCASGSFACAFDYHKNNKSKSLINIINPGGKYLSIFNNNYNDNYIISDCLIEYHDYLE